MEDTQQKINDDIKRVFSNSAVGKETETIRKVVQGILPKGAQVGDIVSVWNAMSRKEKVLWFLFTKWPFKKQGDLLRSSIREAAFYSSEYSIMKKRSFREYVMPLYLYENPKEVCHIVARMNASIERIDVEITV